MEITGVATVLPFHRAVVRAPDFMSETALGIHSRWIETDFADSIAADPEFGTSVPDGVYLDGAGLDGAADGGAGAADPGELRADMAGTVVKWLVEPGAEVSAGDAVVVLEAMKMETQVTAHRAGTLTGIRADAGAVVSAGAVLAIIG
ncbi:UNVERIFIED_ORG: acetyl/propionyl-CoA carboxylase alpha subunit [Arthrobacter sp. UYEF2]